MGFEKHHTPWNKGKRGVQIISEETRRKMSVSHKGKQLGKDNPNFEKHHTPWNKGKKRVQIISEETRRKMSESKKGKGLGKDNPMFGKHHSEETRRKMSEANKGRIPWIKGKHPSEETRRKMSASHKGKQLGKDNPNFGKHPTPWNKGIPRTEEEKKKMSENRKGIPSWFKGKHHSEKTKRKLSESKKGKYVGEKNPNFGKQASEETRKKIKEKRLEQVFPTEDTKFELAVQGQLRNNGIKFEKHKKIKGQPDIFIKPNLCIFLDGDFHHANPSKYSDDFVIWHKRISKSSGRHVEEITAKMIHEKDERVNKELQQGTKSRRL